MKLSPFPVISNILLIATDRAQLRQHSRILL